MRQTIPPRSGIALILETDDLLTVSDPEGGQVSDLVAFDRDDPREVLSNGRTFDLEQTIRLTAGHALWSNRSSKLLEIKEDTLGSHDFLLTPCSIETFRHFYPDKPLHRGCLGNLGEALRPFGIGEDSIPTAFNIFMNVPVSSSGRLDVCPPLSKPGDRVQFKAVRPLIVGLTACSAYASNGGSFKPIDILVERPTRM